MGENFFKRVGNLVRGNAHKAVDKAEAAQPDVMGSQLIRDLEGRVEKTRGAVGQSITERNVRAKELENMREVVTIWQGRAETAAKQGNEPLAKEALVEKRKAQGIVETRLQPAFERLDAQVKGHRESLQELEGKLSDARAQVAVLTARAKAANTTKEVNQTVREMSTVDPGSKLSKMDEFVDRLEAQASAGTELNSTSNKWTEVEAAQRNAGVDDELAALMKRAQGD
jgi:phage shock protein A